MVILASAGVFGSGAYSAAGAKQLRMVGRRTWPVSQIRIRSLRGAPGQRVEVKGRGIWHRKAVDPYMPDHIRDEYHPGGNSLCYTIQTAHLMGCNPIYALGFTLKPGTGYFHGLNNPIWRSRSRYDVPRAIEWLRWYEARFPKRVRLLPGWEGPIYDVFETESFDDYQRILGIGPDQNGSGAPQRDAVSDGGDPEGGDRSVGQERLW